VREKTNEIVQDILDGWNKKFVNIYMIALGDFQKTITTLDHDNKGKFREKMQEDGILNCFLNSHFSVASLDRKCSTRFGFGPRDGSRGIVHIMFPEESGFQSGIVDADFNKKNGNIFLFRTILLYLCQSKDLTTITTT